jgi:hypothetical protein
MLTTILQGYLCDEDPEDVLILFDVPCGGALN